MNKDKRVQILTNKKLWINPDSDIQENIKKAFKEKVELEMLNLTK